MKATELFRARTVLGEDSFAEIGLWNLQRPLAGSSHPYKYLLAYVAAGTCIFRYDNQAGKGDHRHAGDAEHDYVFTTPEKLIDDFRRDITRWNDENSDS